ncbi:WEB family protein At1g12150-like [Ipomoea triloba]|uniref:WEB family protein At1g12150-like n=1 Tax=Ipomoea triloba TaxID=35885 RepID=UPI00125E5CFF|nr:WEB family protein At1g12150-like [Ipomoea triloba]
MKSLDYLEEKFNMGEIIDSKPFESVQAALSLFGDQRKTSPRIKNEQEKEKDLEAVLKEFASLKLQLEAKDSAHKQALFRLSQNESAVEELLAQIMSSAFERDVYLNECRLHKDRAEELELKMKEMSDHTITESARLREQLSCAVAELRAAQAEIFRLETQAVAAGDAKAEALRRAETAEKKIRDQSDHITSLETQIKHLEHEINRDNEDNNSNAQEEIALLKAEIHKQKSKTAESEAAEARAISDKLSLTLVLERLALESKQHKIAEEIREERESDQLRELERLNREVEIAMQKVGEFRTRAEQAISRAEAAENAKARLENRIMRWRELKEKRKQALAALREDSISREKMDKFEYYDYGSPVTTIVEPLGKVLKMKF